MKEQNNLTALAKDEVAACKLQTREEMLAFMGALAYTAGSIVINREGVGLLIKTRSAHVAQTAENVLHALSGNKPTVTRAGKEVSVRLPHAKELLLQLGVLETKEGEMRVCGTLPPLEGQGEAQACVKGAFLGSGSLTAAKYHMEFTFHGLGLAESFADLLRRFDVDGNVIERGDCAKVYVKDGDAICDALALMGASKACLTLNSLIADRQMTELLNRQRNCDMHNIDKQVEASMRQCECIRALDLSGLSPALRDTAEVRLQNPNSSYEELAALLGISKSGVKNRLRRLQAMGTKGDDNE